MFYKGFNRTVFYTTLSAVIIFEYSRPIHFLNSSNGTALYQPIVSMLSATTIIALSVLFLVGWGHTTNLLLFIAILYYWKYFEIRTPQILNNSIVNVGLLNPLNQYHPPLLFYAIVRFSLFFLNQGRVRDPLRPGSGPILTSLILSCWWAAQELFWGSYWNWDPVELTLMVMVLYVVLLIHTASNIWQSLHQRTTLGLLWTSAVLFCYITNRSPAAHSVHSFTKTIFSLVDWPLFWAPIAALLIANCAVVVRWVVSSWRLKRGVMLVTTLLLILTTSIGILINPSKVVGLSDKAYFKTCLVGLVILVKVYKNIGFANAFLSLRVYLRNFKVLSGHALPAVVVYLAIFINEVPTTILYSGGVNTIGHAVRISDVSYCTSSIGSKNNLSVDRSFYRISTKHYAYLSKSAFGYSTRNIFQKSNNAGYFFNIDSNNNIRLLFLIRGVFTKNLW